MSETNGPIVVDYVLLKEGEFHSIILSKKEKEEIVEEFKKLEGWANRIGYLLNFYYNRQGLKFIFMCPLDSNGDKNGFNLMGSYFETGSSWNGNIYFERIEKK